MPIDGLVSGLDTNTIITQLMDLEKRPRLQIQARRDSIQAGLDGLKSIESKLATLTTAASALQRASGWSVRTASSSSPAARVTASTSAGLGSFSFTVDSLAHAHGVATATDSPATASVISSTGQITIHQTDGDHVVSVGTGTLAEVAQAINSAGLGLRAATVRTGSGFRLQISSAASGADSVFTVTGGLDGGGGTVVTTQGTDARITLGTGPGAYGISSSSNTFSEVMPGVAVTVSALSPEPVTVDVSADVTTLGDKVKALVDSVNGALAEISNQTSYDATSKKASALTGDSAARRVTQALTRAVTDAVNQSPLRSAGLAGVALDRTGRVTFDRARFESAFQADPDAVQRLFVQGATTTGSVEFVSSLDRTATASGAVQVDSVPTAGTDTGLTGGWPITTPPTVRVRVGSTAVEYTVLLTDTAAEARTGLQTAIDAAGLALEVTESGGGLAITNRNVGSSSAFEVAWDGASFTSHPGTDITGSIDGSPAEGSGWMLSSPPGSPSPLAGLTVRVTSPGTGAVGTVDYEPGLAQRLAQAINLATDSTTGYLAGSETTRANNVKALDTTIAAYDLRLTAREAQLRKQYAALEVALGNLKNTSNWLTSQLAATNANNSK